MKVYKLISNFVQKYKRVYIRSNRKFNKLIAHISRFLTMTEVIDYLIEDKDSYGKEISHIMEKNTSKKWVSQFALELIEINLKLKNPSYISRIQTRGNSTQLLEIIFKDMDGDKIGTVKISFQAIKKDDMTVKNVDLSQRVSSITLRLLSFDGKPKQMGLNFILFRGEANPLKPSKQKITNLTETHNIDRVKLQTLNAPIRSKPVPTSRPYMNLIKPKEFDQRQKRILPKKQGQKMSDKEEDQIKKALKQSERTFNEENKLKKLLNDKMSSDDNKDDSETVPLAPERKYQIAPLSEMMDCLKFVNSRWLQAQKNAELQVGVREEERLSNYVQIKHLLNKEICIDSESIKGPRKAKLESIAEALGGKVIGSAKNYCIMISTSWENSKVQKAVSSFSGIKAVNEDYLIDCKKLNAELNWKDYSLKK